MTVQGNVVNDADWYQMVKPAQEPGLTFAASQRLVLNDTRVSAELIDEIMLNGKRYVIAEEQCDQQQENSTKL